MGQSAVQHRPSIDTSPTQRDLSVYSANAQSALFGEAQNALTTCFARRDCPIAVVEAKPDYKTPGAGLGQVKEYEVREITHLLKKDL